MPVDVDAVLFWRVFDAEKAAVAVADYVTAMSSASQTALRDASQTALRDMLTIRSRCICAR